MNDDETENPIHDIINDGNAGPYIIVPASKAGKVRDLLRQHDVPFTENPESIVGPNGTDTIFDLGDGADVDAIQSMLDGAAQLFFRRCITTFTVTLLREGEPLLDSSLHGSLFRVSDDSRWQRHRKSGSAYYMLCSALERQFDEPSWQLHDDARPR